MRYLAGVSERLFAYGTLRRGRAPASLERLVADLAWEGEASVAGRLYDLGAYPGLVLDPASASRVHGEVARVPGDPVFWELLDGYEGVDPADPARSLFRRLRREAQLAGGGRVEVWLYEYARDPGAAPLLAGGRYRPAAGRGTLAAPRERRRRG